MALHLQAPTRDPCVGPALQSPRSFQDLPIPQMLRPTRLHWLVPEEDSVSLPSVGLNLPAQTSTRLGRVLLLQPIPLLRLD